MLLLASLESIITTNTELDLLINCLNTLTFTCFISAHIVGLWMIFGFCISIHYINKLVILNSSNLWTQVLDDN